MNVLLIHAVVAGLLQRLCIALHPGFLCLPIDILFFLRSSSRSSPAALYCFAPQFSLSSDWCSFDPQSSSRSSPAALYCFAPQFSLSSDWGSFDPQSSSRPSPAAFYCFVPRSSLYPIDFLSFHVVVPGLLQTALFCSAQRIPFYSRPHSFVSRDLIFCAYLLSRAPFPFIPSLVFYCPIARCPFLSTFSKQ